MSDELALLDAVAQAELVRRREVKPIELVDAAIARIERVDPKVNAVITPLFEQARAAAVTADLPDGPFRGVPLLLKDVGIMAAGLPYYAGNRALRDAKYVSPDDSALAVRFRRAGFIFLGKTNTPEFGSQTTTQPLAFGPTHNPWNLEHSTGGSSGGSCAAVAAGLVSVAHANDGGGSIRIPAAWCGLPGLKPTRGRVPSPIPVNRAVVELVVSRSLRDVAAVLDAVHGAEPGELYVWAPPARRYADEVGADPGRLRIGLLTAMPGIEVHPECLRATEEAASLLESLGHRVEHAWPAALHDEEIGHRMAPMFFAGARLQLRALSAMLGRQAGEDDVEPYYWAAARPDGPTMSAEDALEASVAQQEWSAKIVRWWSEGYDLLLTPTLCEPPPTLKEMTPPADKPWKLGRTVLRHCAFTQAFNITGQPAISLPLHWTPDGLPVGVHLVADMGREDLLLRVAAQLETERPWRDRRPPIHA